MTKSRGVIRKRWVPDEVALELVRRNFACSRTADIAQALGVAPHQVDKLARRLGLKKDPDWLSSPMCKRLNGTQGAGNRFQKGSVSWNKGLRMPGHGSPQTQFKPGQKPRNYSPPGSLRVASTGYLQIKIHDTGYPPHDWVMYHRWLWEQTNGPIPAGHIVAFKDGIRRLQPDEITLDVLVLRSRKEHILVHSIHTYGPEVAHLMQLRGAITRQINKRQKDQT